MPRYKVRDIPYSLRFNGSSSYVRASSLTNMSLGYSVGAWVKLRTINGGAVFTNATAADDRCGITTSSTGFVRAGYYNGTSYVDPVSSDSPLVPGRWTHIAHVFDGSSSSLYVNGVLQSGTDQPAVSANNVLELGRKQDSTLYIHADLSEFVVQKGVQWTQSDVINVMNGIFPSGMERIYRLNEGAGTTAYDSSGNGNDGTITNGTWSTDSPSKARTPAVGRRKDRDMKASLVKTADAQYINLGPKTYLDGKSFSFMTWYKPFSGSHVLADLGYNNGSNVGYLVRLSPSNKVQIYTGNSSVSPTANTALNTAEWNHVAVTYDLTTSTLRYYFNGSPDGEVNGVPSRSMEGDVLLFSENTVSNARAAGAEVVIVDRVLTADEIMNHAKRFVAPSNTLGYYKLDEGAGAVAYDSSGNGNDGTIVGASFTNDAPSKPRQPVNRNLVYNGDFEYAPPITESGTSVLSRWIDGTVTGSTTNRLFGWFLFDATGTRYAQFDDTESYSGDRSLKIGYSTAGGHIQVFNTQTPYNTIPCLPNTSYTLKYRMKTNVVSGSGNGARATLSIRDGSGAFITDVGGPLVNTTTDWTEYTVTATTGNSGRFLLVKLENSGMGGSANLIMDAWFDDIVLKPTTPVTRQMIA